MATKKSKKSTAAAKTAAGNPSGGRAGNEKTHCHHAAHSGSWATASQITPGQ
jgi:hypothetical protein